MIPTEFNTIKNSLKILKKLERLRITYRVLGSILLAAIHGSPHRKIGDIDLLIDSSNKRLVFSTLKHEGFKIVLKKKCGFKWYEAIRKDCIPLTFLLIGTFTKKFFAYKILPSIELRISNEYIQPHRYSLFKTKIVGIPLRSVFEGIKVSNLNPKRKLDKIIFLSHFKTMPQGMSIEKGIAIYILGIRIPRLYGLFSFVYNIYGGMRVLWGKKYESW